jgi:hypothetical protein
VDVEKENCLKFLSFKYLPKSSFISKSASSYLVVPELQNNFILLDMKRLGRGQSAAILWSQLRNSWNVCQTIMEQTLVGGRRYSVLVQDP